MLVFLSFLIVSGMIFMGIGGILALVYMFMHWALSGRGAMINMWRERTGFHTLEFIERTVDEITGVTPEPIRQKPTDEGFGAAAGCLAILVFVPWHLFVVPIWQAIFSSRKRRLRNRVIDLPPEQYFQLSEEYREWLQA